ncbi:MAG: hypothetical protein LUH08_00365, partial [Ruminococcus sp.]|nr:hypothetical protein [Ruminococcus sp.]
AITKISIHAPRVRGDCSVEKTVKTFDISIHAPRVRGDYESNNFLRCCLRIFVHFVDEESMVLQKATTKYTDLHISALRIMRLFYVCLTFAY